MGLTTTTTLLLVVLLGFCNGQHHEHHGHDHGAHTKNSTYPHHKEDITKTIQRMNNGSSEFVEGDLILPKTRSAMKCASKTFSCLWPKSANGKVEISYVLSDKYDTTEKNEILRALKDFETKTCIRFLPHQGQTAYLSFEPRNGCAALLGYTGDRQVVSLQKLGCVSFGIIQHEVMHTLGFYHEHTRSDRDQYVHINWDNITDSFTYNFEKADTDNLNTTYDYNSVMHYSKTAYGKNGAVTITPIPDPNVPIGQIHGMSELDVLRINRLYKCSGH